MGEDYKVGVNWIESEEGVMVTKTAGIPKGRILTTTLVI